MRQGPARTGPAPAERNNAGPAAPPRGPCAQQLTATAAGACGPPSLHRSPPEIAARNPSSENACTRDCVPCSNGERSGRDLCPRTGRRVDVAARPDLSRAPVRGGAPSPVALAQVCPAGVARSGRRPDRLASVAVLDGRGSSTQHRVMGALPVRGAPTEPPDPPAARWPGPAQHNREPRPARHRLRIDRCRGCVALAGRIRADATHAGEIGGHTLARPAAPVIESCPAEPGGP